MEKIWFVRPRLGKYPTWSALTLSSLALILSACAGGTPPRPSQLIAAGAVYPDTRPLEPSVFGAVPVTALNGPTAGDEFFSAAAYGVTASPRVAPGTQLQRGGGYYKVGSPYTVAGRRYYPTESPKKVQQGRASWYGAAFHGRKTANGEIYDMNHLTAAHKTMPLPSYARVTNLANNRSIVVRVNDRGPFSNNRIIDLSKRAADLLDYTRAGTAQVKVDYLGPAPLHGHDDAFLASSFRGPASNGFGSAFSAYFPSDYAAQKTVSGYATMRVEQAFSKVLVDAKPLD